MRATALALVALICTPPALAADLAPQNQAAEAPKLDSHLQAALDVLEAAHAKNNMEALIDVMADNVLGSVRQDHPNANDKTLTAFREAFREEMKAEIPELMKLQASVYAAHFSEADLKTVAAFYRSDVGSHYISEQAIIMKETSPIAVKWGRETALRAIQKATERLQKQGVKL